MTYDEWEKIVGPVPNCCARCAHETTCGYSFLVTNGKRDPEYSFGPCVLGERSGGAGPFFRPAESKGKG